MEKILCVDDTSLACFDSNQDELTEEGYKVVLAKDGKEAPQNLRRRNPQVVVMDIRDAPDGWH